MVPDNIKKMLESDDPKERVVGVYALGGNLVMLREALRSCPSHADVANAIARQLRAFPEMLVDMVPGFCSKDITNKDKGGEPAYKATVEALASMVDELDDCCAHIHISLVSENALARRISVRKLKDKKDLLQEIALTSDFEDTRKQAIALMEEKDK